VTYSLQSDRFEISIGIYSCLYAIFVAICTWKSWKNKKKHRNVTRITNV